MAVEAGDGSSAFGQRTALQSPRDMTTYIDSAIPMLRTCVLDEP